MNLPIPISLGDIARVQGALRPADVYTWNRILEQLGLPVEFCKSQTEQGEQLPPDDEERSEGPTPLEDVERDDQEFAPPDAKEEAVFRPGAELDVTPKGSAIVPPDWGEEGAPAALDQGEEFDLGPPPTLFTPGQGRALLTALAIGLSESGELDEERALAEIARGEPLREIPLRLRPTSRFGVQLLMDRGPRLQPFREDQEGLVHQLCDIVGRHRVELLRFRDFPDFAGPGTRRTWCSYRPPAAGTIVLLVSDLGLGRLQTERAAGLRNWIDWGKTVHSAGARPVALVPHGPRHWPSPLRQSMKLVHWDRSATVGAVRAGQARSRRRP